MKKKTYSVKLPLSTEKRVQLAVLSTFFVIWILLLQGLFKFRGVDWFYQIIFCRFLSIYCLIAMVCQSFLSIFEGPKTIEFYQYIPYFVLISTLSLNGRLIDWLKYAGPLILGSMLIPLHFKDSSYFESIGSFTYAFTTPIAVLFVSFIVARISAGKFEALTKNLSLQKKLFEVESTAKADLAAKLEEARSQIERDAAQVALSQIAQQVVHDIRSPMAVLNSVIHSMENVESDVRTQIKAVAERIQGIANNLLKYKPQTKTEHNDSNDLSNEIISALLENVIAEKKMQTSPSPNFTLNLFINSDAQSSRSLVNKVEFCSLVSNLINNSIESLDSEGEIYIKLSRNALNLILEITDNGKGIPADVLKNVGRRGYSYNKINGSGLGLYYAISNLRAWGGDFGIDSSVGKGTQIRCQLSCTEN
jgi:signal transduction histidine kinase